MDDRITQLAKELDFVGRMARQRKVREIAIDDREDRDRLTELLLAGMGYTVVRRRLPLGDYQWESKLGLIIVERKTPADLRDVGRLSQQAVRLRRASTEAGIFPIILIDHRWDTDRERAWSDHQMDNALVSVSGRIRIARCLQGQLSHRLDSLFRWSQRTDHQLLDRSF